MYAYSHLSHIDIFTHIDLQFAGFMAQLSKTDDPSIPLAAALVSSRTRSGDVCLDLASVAGMAIDGDKKSGGGLNCPSLEKWREMLFKSAVVGRPGDYQPMILDDHNRLYFQRYWQYEQTLADFLMERANRQSEDIDLHIVGKSLNRLFPTEPNAETDWQKIAAIVAALKKLCVISGGPGTGKTFAVTRILAFLLELNKGKELKIFLAAPTGKAAARLIESISQAKKQLPCKPEIIGAIPEQGFTIHRLLGSTRDTGRFFYHSGNRLPADVLVVDEASMVDLPLMSKLVQALSDETRLLLLGDRDQLSSVEAGSVLGDICGEERQNRYSDGFRKEIEAICGAGLENIGKNTGRSGLRDSTVYFSKNYRFDDTSGILKLGGLINAGRTRDAISLLNSGMCDDVEWTGVFGKKELYDTIKDKVLQYFKKISLERDPEKALIHLGRFRILCALNHGKFGVHALNTLAVQILEDVNVIKRNTVDSVWYHGRPILIRKNDYRLGLYNGDIGVAMQAVSDKSEELSVFFQGVGGEIKQVPTYQLPEHETAYAMTIHKSQGSEFADLLMVLPDKDSPVLTRELVYTGITRARQNLSLLCTESAISSAISRRIERTSGLRDKLSAAM